MSILGNWPNNCLSNSIGAEKEGEGSQGSLKSPNVVDNNNLPDQAYNHPANSKDGLSF